MQERQAQPEDNKQAELPAIDTTDMDEEGFLKAACEAIGTISKTPQNTLDKESFIKVFKYTGEFAKFKNTEIKRVAQAKRCEHFGGEPSAYLTALKANI